MTRGVQAADLGIPEDESSLDVKIGSFTTYVRQ